MDMVDLSIVIVSWNTRELLKDCLNSINQYTKGISYEVFVVDNASSDGSADMVRQFFPDVHVISNLENAGFSKANNQAIKISKGRYVSLLNPDTLLIEDVFTPLIKYADDRAEIGAIGPKILSRDGKRIDKGCARRLPNLYFEFCRLSGLSGRFPKSRIFGSECTYTVDHTNSRYVDGLSGSCMVVRRTTIDDVGLMDENQFMYGDDIDWCMRFLNAGWKIYYYANASIIHYGGESAKQVTLSTILQAEKARIYYYRKYNGKLYAFVFSLLISFFSLVKYIWNKLLKSGNPDSKELTNIYKSTFAWSIKQLGSSGELFDINGHRNQTSN